MNFLLEIYPEVSFSVKHTHIGLIMVRKAISISGKLLREGYIGVLMLVFWDIKMLILHRSIDSGCEKTSVLQRNIVKLGGKI